MVSLSIRLNLHVSYTSVSILHASVISISLLLKATCICNIGIITLKGYKECPVNTLKEYLKISSKERKDDNLFLSYYVKP